MSGWQTLSTRIAMQLMAFTISLCAVNVLGGKIEPETERERERKREENDRLANCDHEKNINSNPTKLNK